MRVGLEIGGHARVPAERLEVACKHGLTTALTIRTARLWRCRAARCALTGRQIRPTGGWAHVFGRGVLRCESAGRAASQKQSDQHNPFHFFSPFRTSSTTRRRYSAIEIPNRLAPRRSHSIVASGNRTRVGFIMDKTYIGPISVVNRAA